MGFQGDVAGIGLGELLQGLARGGREGVLTLRGGRLGSTIGVETGKLFLLPEPDEDPEIWRKRCERAWVKDPNHRIDTLRMSEIAYATRLEGMFKLLDHEGGVHFKFEEGPLPRPSTPAAESGVQGEVPLARAETGVQIDVRVAIHCPPISVEFLLLEHARLSDECQGNGDSTQLSLHGVPRLLEAEPPSQGQARMWEECDGMSNLIEIADRLGQPIRQIQGTMMALAAQGKLRFADARELLVLAQNELKQNRFARAGSRLSGWVEFAPPGTPAEGDAHLLITEWNKGKLPVVLASMGAREGRSLLRKMEAAERDPNAAILRWQEMRKHHRHDSISEVRGLHWQLRGTDEADLPSTSELIRVARKFEEQGRILRAGVVLRAAASLMPEGAGARIELGVRMLANDMVEEGAPWILEACRALIETDACEKAASPLQSLLTADPNNRDARALLGLARKRSDAGKRVRRNTLIALSVLLSLSVVAFVRVRFQASYDRRLEDVKARMDQPELALRMLEADFSGDDSPDLVKLRQMLFQQLMARETSTRDDWLASYDAAFAECTTGDPMLGLKASLEVTAPPDLRYLPDPEWPVVDDLLDGLCARLEQTVAEWGAKDLEFTESLKAEQRLTSLVDGLLAAVEDQEHTRSIENFQVRLGILRTTLVERGALRAAERQSQLKEQRLEKQNMLLQAARMHNVYGDLERSVAAFHELVEMEGSETIARVLADEIAVVEKHWSSVQAARRLALANDHAGARAALEEGCPDLSEHLLPWNIDTHPSGARTRLPDGWERVTPFTMESAFGERVELTFQLEGHEPRTLRIDEPGTRFLPMSRLADFWWRNESRITALPVEFGGNYICADRSGRVVRLASEGPRWTVELDSIGGVARTPVILPKLSGTILLLSEEGDAWFVDAATGESQGPHSLGSPPASGPVATLTGATATFVDGRLASWDRKLQPAISALGHDDEDTGPARDSFGANGGLAVLRRSAETGTQLDSPWTDWSISVEATSYAVRFANDLIEPFHVSRDGDWNYMAWEAPTSALPYGRLWISDDVGLRAFTP